MTDSDGFYRARYRLSESLPTVTDGYRRLSTEKNRTAAETECYLADRSLFIALMIAVF